MEKEETRGRKRKILKHATDKEPANGIYYTVKEAAEILGVDKHTVQARLRDGTIKGKIMGNRWRIYKEELYRKEG